MERRSSSAIAVRLSKLKLTAPQNPRWNEAEDAELFRLVGEKVKLKEIPSLSPILSSRSPSAVKNRWSFIGKHKKAGKKWTREEDSFFVTLSQRAKALSEFLGSICYRKNCRCD